MERMYLHGKHITGKWSVTCYIMDSHRLATGPYTHPISLALQCKVMSGNNTKSRLTPFYEQL